MKKLIVALFSLVVACVVASEKPPTSTNTTTVAVSNSVPVSTNLVWWRSSMGESNRFLGSAPRLDEYLVCTERIGEPFARLCSHFNYYTEESIEGLRWLHTDVLLIGHGYALPEGFGGFRFQPEAHWVYPECDNSPPVDSVSIGFSFRLSF
jgi:hypothetical protein